MLDLTKERDSLIQLPIYIANPSFVGKTGWKKKGSGNIVVDKENGQPITMIAVGQVMDDRPCCGPMGNFTDKGEYPKPLQDAKFTMVIGEPTDPQFADDSTLYGPLCTTWREEFQCLTTDGTCWKKRGHRSLSDSAHLRGRKRSVTLSNLGSHFNIFWQEDVEPDSVLADVETINWPVPSQHRSKLDAIKDEYRVIPLPIYGPDRHFIESPHANSALREALVEVHFQIKHYAIKKTPPYDTFSAIALQVLLLKKGVPKTVNPYHQSMRAGPKLLRKLASTS
jgi:hypothetical protein